MKAFRQRGNNVEQQKSARRLKALGAVTVGLVLSMSLVGCGESEEKQAFRQNLIDKALNDDTRKAGEAFLAANKQRDGVVTLPSGLQYQVLASAPEQSSSSVQVTMAKGVEVHYRGETIEGVEFESTLAGEPVRLEVKKLLRGWQQALLKMRPGDHWRLFVPADLAYGARSPSELIPANSALVFELELKKVYDISPP